MDFKKILEEEQQKKYFKDLMQFLDERYENGAVYPAKEDLFKAFELCDMDDIKAVIIGQDPYHQKGQAMGLAFSVYPGIKIPPSLVNIYKELHDDVNVEIPLFGDLSSWAKQGVLLMNSVMSVEDSQPNIHKDKGWEIFTDRIMLELNKEEKGIVFILWGKPASLKAKCIDNPKHLIIQSVHPSPLSCYRGFYGSKPFSKTNSFLKKSGRKEIDWSIKNEV